MNTVTMFLVLTLGVASAAASQQPAAPSPSAVPRGPEGPQGPIEMPATAVGQSVQALAAAINGAGTQGINAWTAAHMSDELEAGWSRNRFAAMFARIQAQSGGLDPMDLRLGDDPGYLGVIFGAKNGKGRVGLEFFSEARKPGRISHVNVHPMPDPGPRPAPWPKGELGVAGIIAAVEQRLEYVAANDQFSGVVLLARGDSILLHRAYGLANREQNVPNTTGTRFHVASVPKMFTGVAIGQLVDAKKLRYTDTLAAVLPNYPNQDAARRITIEQLLTHTAGVPDVLSLPEQKPGTKFATPWDNVRAIGDLPLDFEPGERFQYSNGGYAVLAAVVEQVAGMPFDKYLQSRIFRPAGMRVADPAKYATLPAATGYAHSSELDPFAAEPRTPSERARGEGTVTWPGYGGGYMTADDLFRFFRALRSGWLVDPETAERLTSGKVPVAPDAPIKIGYGFQETPLSSKSLRGHSGGGGNSGIGAHAEMLWEGDWTLIILGNYDLKDIRPLTMSIASFISRQ